MGYVEELRQLVGKRPLILVGSVVMIMDNHHQVLLEKRQFPNGVWGLPGGLMELGESTEETAKREALEETGLEVKSLKLINVYSGSEYFTKAQNGDEFYSVTTAYYTYEFSGQMKINSNESMDLKFFKIEKLPQQMIGSHREIINDFRRNVKTFR